MSCAHGCCYGRLILSVIPAILFGAYLLFGAAYRYRKGELRLKSPATVTRRESPSRCLFGIALIALWGIGCVALGIYSLIRGLR
jgi:hypothetical protein